MKVSRMVVATTVLTLAVALVMAATTSAITLTQAEAPIPVQTAGFYAGDVGGANGGADDVADLDTKEPTGPVTTNNIVLLVAALGVLIGVLIVTRRKSGPDA